MNLFDDMFGNVSEAASIDDKEAGRLLAEMFNEKLTSRELALQFVLEELDAARQGNETSIYFAKNSGFELSQYINALHKTSWEGDESELEYLQLYSRKILLKIGDTDTMVRVSLDMVDNVMRKWKLGKYDHKNKGKFSNDLSEIVKKESNSEIGIFADIVLDIDNTLGQGLDMEPVMLMALSYARQVAISGLSLQGAFGKEEYQKQVIRSHAHLEKIGFTKELQLETYKIAMVLLQSYSSRLTVNTCMKILETISNPTTVSAHELGAYHEFDSLLDMFEQ